MIEIWKDIKNYEGCYQVSNYDNVKSIERIVNHSIYGKLLIKSKILKTSVTNKGYLIVGLWKNNKGKSKTIHRLVIGTFISNPNNKLQVNHKDGNKTNNYLTNLEWSTSSENIKHAYNNNLIHSKTIPVLQFSKNDEFLKEFNSITEASNYTNIDKSEISSVCHNRRNRKFAGGFIWKFK